MRLARFFPLVVGVTLALVFACGASPVGIDACRAVEAARCAWGPACGVNMNVPVRRADSTSPVDDCIRYYNDACLHGIAGPNAPSNQQQNDCITAINAGDCAIVLAPEKSPACSWILPGPDSSVPDTSVVETSTE